MLPSRHIIVSISLGAITWAYAQSLLAGLICFCVGVFCDLDHIIEYAINYDLRSLSVKRLYQASADLIKPESEIKKIRLFFHTAELAILLWVIAIFSNNIFVLAAALGYSAHIMMDMAANILKPAGYFMFWRIKNSFQTARLVKNY